MKYTNKHNLPPFIVDFLKSDNYDYEEGVISATTLMQPPRMFALTRKNEDLEVDVSDLIAARYGTSIHDAVEKVKIPGALQEERVYAVVDFCKISGKADIILDVDTEPQLMDVKSTSVWTYIFKSREEDYKKQLSIYRYLLVKNGINAIDTAKIWYFFTDWSNSKSQNDPNYPQTRTMVYDIRLYSIEETEAYIKDRLKVLLATLEMDQKDMPECTSNELWQKPTKWAIMKEGRKSAVKVHDDESEAFQHLDGLDDKHYLVTRPGEVKRCNYCHARRVCEQYRRLREEGLCN